MTRTLDLENVSPKLQRIATRAWEAPQLVFNSLAHLIDVELLRVAYQRTRKDGAVGVDHQTATEFEQQLEGNLRSLVDRMHSGRYLAPPVRRVHIPKGDGRTRPIGIPTFEDKVLQRGAAMVLEAIYEQDFLDCSYGFRPGRSAHDALEALWQGLYRMRGGWVLEVDIQSFFDTIDHGHLRAFLDLRVRDGVLRRTIDKWLNAGVMEAGATWVPDAGTPQGGVISPLLANIYLHHVLDVWFEREVKPRLGGDAFLVRYADDFVIVFAHEVDARRVEAVLPKRFAKYGLTLHPTKTQLIDFRRPPRDGDATTRQPPDEDGLAKTFELLGFVHYWGKSRQGNRVVQRKTASSRLSRALARISDWCRRNMHLPVRDQHVALCAKVRGHNAYFGISGNVHALGRFRYEVERIWQRWMSRRSRSTRLRWDRFHRRLSRYPLPAPRIVHGMAIAQRTA